MMYYASRSPQMPTTTSALIDLYLSDGLRDLQRRARGLLRRARGRRRRLSYIHELDDPYSLLLAQVLPRLLVQLECELDIVIAPAPDPAFRPDPERLGSWGLRDAAGLARQHGLRFPARAQVPEHAALETARARALERVAQPGDPAETLAALVELSHALLAGEPIEPAGTVRPASANAPHYMGAMIGYEGEWYWGLDRLTFLVERLRAEGETVSDLLVPGAPVEAHEGQLWGAPLPEPGAPLELFYSVRSPYSYLVLERAAALASRHQTELQIRLVLPMVARGLPVPRAKRMYIVRDCKRIAGALGLPFGRICDPLAAIEPLLAIAVHAQECGQLVPWLRGVGRAAWGEGLDLRSEDARARLARTIDLEPREHPEWRDKLASNRQALLDMGLWGVPSLRVGELCVWGQDRLDVIDAALGHRP